MTYSDLSDGYDTTRTEHSLGSVSEEPLEVVLPPHMLSNTHSVSAITYDIVDDPESMAALIVSAQRCYILVLTLRSNGS